MTPILKRIIICALALLSLNAPLLAADQDLLLRWPAHEGTGTSVQDTSGNGLDGHSAAGWIANGSLKTLFFDGQSKSVVSVQIPAGKYLGAGDWTFMTWLRPEVLGFPGQQDQRRIFNYGNYPDASMNLDLTGQGEVIWYFVYKNAEGKSVATGGGSSARVKPRTWIHAALVTDHRNARVTIYLNGREAGQNSLPENWAGNFSLGNELTIGASWQNYHGAMADVAVWRRALEEREIKSLFRAQGAAYGVKLGDGLTAEDFVSEFAEQGNEAMAQKKTAEARAAFGKILATAGVPPGWVGWAELRMAQAYRLEKNDTAAKEIYQRLRGGAAYLAHHRQEAAELLQEMERTARGLPARDVMASRTVLPAIDHYAAEVWVAPDGSDANSGQAGKPVATLNRAQQLVRGLRHSVTGPIAVILKNGVYPVKDGLKLTAEDSGSADAPVVWKAAESGQAVLYGGLRLKGFAPVTDASVTARLDPKARGHVMMCDLKQLGLSDYGKLGVRGFGQPASPPTVELYVDNEPQTLARWPNEGFVSAGKLISPGDRAKGIPSVFEYLDGRHARWTKAEDPWLFGYWHYLWADATLKIAKIDPATKRITSAEAYSYDGGMNAEQGIKYFAFNLLEELDTPGEWYLDRSKGLLYLWPTGDPQRQVIELGVLSSPFVTVSNASHVRFEGIVFDLGRYDGIQISGGDSVQLVGCVVRRVAGTGVAIADGFRHALLGCDIHHTGRAATTLVGGDRTTLQRADFLIENCHLHHFGRIDRTYTPAIQAEGVGMRVAHNLMHDCPSSAIRADGNEMLFEYNEVHSVVRESDDQGGMESFGNPSFRGLVFRYNRYENIGNGATMTAGQAAIRFDDVISGELVYGNLFIRSANGQFGAIQLNSGRDNIMDNNVFVDCKIGISGGWRKGNVMWAETEQKKRADIFQNELYFSRYPEMRHMLEGEGRNFAWRTALIDCGTPISEKGLFDIVALHSWTSKDPGIADSASHQWNLAPDSEPVLRLGIRPIPLNEIGLYADRTRASWPVTTTPVAVPDWRQHKKAHP